VAANDSAEIPNENIVKLLRNKLRHELTTRTGFVFGTTALILLLGALFYWPIKLTKNGKLTDLEQFLFQLFLVGLAGAISWVIAKRQEERNVLTKQKALASSALRRIASIASAARRLAEGIESRKLSAKSSPDWTEMKPIQRTLLFELFDGLGRQVVEMRDNIGASEGDWRDILPEEFALKRLAEAEILDLREAAIQQKQQLLEEMQKTLGRGETRTQEQISALKEAFASKLDATEKSLSVKVEQIQSRLPPTIMPSASGLNFLSGFDITPSKLEDLFIGVPKFDPALYSVPRQSGLLTVSPIADNPVDASPASEPDEDIQLKNGSEKPKSTGPPDKK
jgi:hypothetical protein